MGAIFFEPIFKEKIWGGNRLQSFGYQLPSDRIGECWAFAAHDNGQSIIKNGEYKGKTLGELWKNNREFFGEIEGEQFPLLVKIIDAGQDLSVQVHPDDDYAFKKENQGMGKTECWYVIDCNDRDSAQLVLGINAQSKEELEEMIDNGQWDKLLRIVPIKKGDFIFVPSGTVHALKKGTLVLEIQQNSDITYRLYDYDRRDAQGKLRELHTDKAKEVIQVPYRDMQYKPKIKELEGVVEVKLMEYKYFTVYKYEINGEAQLEKTPPFMLFSVLEGEGLLRIDREKYTIKKGDHFMLPKKVSKYRLKGKLTMIASHT